MASNLLTKTNYEKYEPDPNSGSGKSSLIKQVIANSLLDICNAATKVVTTVDKLNGQLKNLFSSSSRLINYTRAGLTNRICNVYTGPGTLFNCLSLSKPAVYADFLKFLSIQQEIRKELLTNNVQPEQVKKIEERLTRNLREFIGSENDIDLVKSRMESLLVETGSYAFDDFLYDLNDRKYVLKLLYSYYRNVIFHINNNVYEVAKGYPSFSEFCEKNSVNGAFCIFPLGYDEWMSYIHSGAYYGITNDGIISSSVRFEADPSYALSEPRSIMGFNYHWFAVGLEGIHNVIKPIFIIRTFDVLQNAFLSGLENINSFNEYIEGDRFEYMDICFKHVDSHFNGTGLVRLITTEGVAEAPVGGNTVDSSNIVDHFEEKIDNIRQTYIYDTGRRASLPLVRRYESSGDYFSFRWSIEKLLAVFNSKPRQLANYLFEKQRLAYFSALKNNDQAELLHHRIKNPDGLSLLLKSEYNAFLDQSDEFINVVKEITVLGELIHDNLIQNFALCNPSPNQYDSFINNLVIRKSIDILSFVGEAYGTCIYETLTDLFYNISPLDSALPFGYSSAVLRYYGSNTYGSEISEHVSRVDLRGSDSSQSMPQFMIGLSSGGVRQLIFKRKIHPICKTIHRLTDRDVLHILIDTTGLKLIKEKNIFEDYLSRVINEVSGTDRLAGKVKEVLYPFELEEKNKKRDPKTPAYSFYDKNYLIINKRHVVDFMYQDRLSLRKPNLRNSKKFRDFVVIISQPSVYLHRTAQLSYIDKENLMDMKTWTFHLLGSFRVDDFLTTTKVGTADDGKNVNYAYGLQTASYLCNYEEEWKHGSLYSTLEFIVNNKEKILSNGFMLESVYNDLAQSFSEIIGE